MAKAAGLAAGMQSVDLRAVLKAARHDSVSVAFAVGADGRAILQMDRRKPPRALEKMLKDDAPDARGHRFGTVAFDAEQPGLARFVVNKAAGGMARKLLAALKGTGVRSVDLVLEDGTAVDSAAGGDDPPDPAVLTRDLTGLVKRVLGVLARDPGRKAALSRLATDAQASLKLGDLENAAEGIEALRRALDEGAEAAPAGGDDPAVAAQRYLKARAAWLATRLKVDADLGRLGPVPAALAPVLAELDDGLADQLAAAARVAGTGREDELRQQVRATLERYAGVVAGSAALRELDGSPVQAPGVGRTLEATLTTLAALLR